MNDLPTVLTVAETSKFLRLGRTATYAAIRAGDIPCVRLGHAIRVPRAALLALLGEQASNGNGSAGTEPVAHTTPANGAPGHGSG